MLLSQTAEYALRAVIHIAQHAGDGPVRANAIAPALGVPANYLAKTLHQLVRAGVLRSARGPQGGFRLARPAAALTIAQIVACFTDTGERRCLLADRPCGEDPGCPVHARWRPVAAHMYGFLGTTTIADLLGDAAAPCPPAPPTARPSTLHAPQP